MIIPPHYVTVHYTSPTGGKHKVEFIGDPTTWDAKRMHRKGRTWSWRIPVYPDSRFEYKFIVDGKWILDPNNPNHQPNGMGDNSIYQGAAYTCVVPDGEPKTPLTRQLLHLDGRDVIVYAPAESKGLPILAYGDGENYEAVGKIQNIVENLVEAGKIRPAVLALIPPKDRTQEYWKNWKPYCEWMLRRAIPAVRQATGASDKASDLFVGGSSLGGVISLRLAETYPSLVAGGVHSQSGAFQWKKMDIHVDELIRSRELARLAPTTRLWMDWGTYEGTLTRANNRAVGRLRRMHRPFGSTTTHEGHNWTAWRHRMVEGLVFLLGR